MPIITRSPKARTPSMARLPYDRFMLLHSDIPKHIHQLKACKKLISESSLISEQCSSPLPIDCDQVIECLETMEPSITKILEIVKSLKDQPISVHPNRYKLLMYLYAADDCVHTAIRSVDQFRSICTSTSSKAVHGQAKVQEELLSFVQACEKIETEAETMVDFLLLHS